MHFAHETFILMIRLIECDRKEKGIDIVDSLIRIAICAKKKPILVAKYKKNYTQETGQDMTMKRMKLMTGYPTPIW